jgi:mannose-6-phosphate isomerase-like protein (cupin superfamily)
MNWHDWIRQSLPRTEIMRGGATVWEAGAQGLSGDTLGPVMHLHDGASEIFYFVSGRCRLEVGDTEELFGPGDFALLPPEVPHNLWNAADEDLLVFWIVAPHLREAKWRTENISSKDMQRRLIRARVEAGVSLPSDANIHNRLVTLQPEESLSERTKPGQEVVLYVTSGQAQVNVGKLSGRLEVNDFVHVPVDTAYGIAAASGAASVLLFQMPGI